jgi:hypothetical protein
MNLPSILVSRSMNRTSCLMAWAIPSTLRPTDLAIQCGPSRDSRPAAAQVATCASCSCLRFSSSFWSTCCSHERSSIRSTTYPMHSSPAVAKRHNAERQLLHCRRDICFDACQRFAKCHTYVLFGAELVDLCVPYCPPRSQVRRPTTRRSRHLAHTAHPHIAASFLMYSKCRQR